MSTGGGEGLEDFIYAIVDGPDRRTIPLEGSSSSIDDPSADHSLASPPHGLKGSLEAFHRNALLNKRDV